MARNVQYTCDLCYATAYSEGSDIPVKWGTLRVEQYIYDYIDQEHEYIRPFNPNVDHICEACVDKVKALRLAKSKT